MKKSKLDYISKKQILIAIALIIVLVFIPFIFISCTSTIVEFAEGGCKLNRVIFTNNPEEYVAGRTPAEEIYNVYGENVHISNLSEIPYDFYETDEPGVYDLIMIGTEGNSPLSINQYTNYLYSSAYSSQIRYPMFDNNYIFSGIHQMFNAGGNWECSDHNCVCGPWQWEMGDNCWICACQSSPGILLEPKTITVNNELTEDEIIQNLNITCNVCMSYEKVNNEDGTITYTKTLIDSHSVYFNHDGTFKDFRQKYFGNSNPKELIIDGFDFSVMHEYVANYPYYSGYKGNWYVRYKPESYNHMFSDLSVEKITIKNATGLTNAKDLSSMFENCPNLRTVEFGNLFEGCQPTNISRMFYNCPNLEYVDLSSLDTSCVTDMSYMFALSGGMISVEARDFELERVINNYVQTDEEFADFNDGTVYTIDSFISKAYELYGMTITKEELYIIFEIPDIPLTYDEYCLKTFGVDLIGFYNLIQEDPTQFELSVKDDGYDTFDVIKIVEATALSEGIEVIHEMELQNNKSRDDILNFFINHTLVPIHVDEYDILDVNETYTIDMVAAYFGVPKELIVCEIVSKLAEAKSTIIPISYNEAVSYTTQGEINFDELVTELLKTQDEDLPPKEDGSKYSRKEVVELLKTEIDSGAVEHGIVVVDEIELESYYAVRPASAQTLILGGEGSKFVINNGTNVKNMFGASSIFKEIITPNKIGDDIEIVLSNKYTETKIPDGTPIEDESLFVLTLTSQDANKSYFSYSEIKEDIEDTDNPDIPVVPDNPSGENNSTMTDEEIQTRKNIVIFVFASLILCVIIMTIRIAIKLNRRRRLWRFVREG